MVKNERSGLVSWIVLSENGVAHKATEGDCVLRWDDSAYAREGDWQVGDKFFFYQQDTAAVNVPHSVDLGIDDLKA